MTRTAWRLILRHSIPLFFFKYFFYLLVTLFHISCVVSVWLLSIRDTCFPPSEGGCASKALQRSACLETVFLTAFLTSTVILHSAEEASQGWKPMNKNVSHLMYNGSEIPASLPYLHFNKGWEWQCKKQNNLHWIDFMFVFFKGCNLIRYYV